WGGGGWRSLAIETMRRVNGIEIVNNQASEGPLAGWPLWARMLNTGLRLTAIGGSDDHTADETTDHAIGTPATVVYATELSEPALLQGLRQCLAYVRTRGPAGSVLEFQALYGDLRWIMGETIPNSVRDIILSVAASPATGQHVQWVRNGVVVATTTIAEGQPAKLNIQPQPGDWF